MKKLTILVLTLCFSSAVFAQNEKFLCSMIYAPGIKKEVLRHSSHDKTLHCMASCMLTLKCFSFDVFTFGLLKEIADAVGPGDADVADIRANEIGISLVTEGIATTKNSCINYCKDHPWETLED